MPNFMFRWIECRKKNAGEKVRVKVDSCRMLESGAQPAVANGSRGYFWNIRELVDPLCRDGADAQYMQYLSKSRTTSPQTRKKLIWASRLPVWVPLWSARPISGQKPRGRQINTKVCISKCLFRILVTAFVQTISHKLFKYSLSF